MRSERARELFRAARAFAALWITLGGFAAAELALRLHWFGVEALLFPWRYTATRLFNTDLVLEDDDPGIAWRLRPGMRSYYLGAAFTTNRHGFRDPERSTEPPPGVLRIAALGASITMGAGVSDDEVYPRRIEQRIEARWPGRFQVLNFGVGAYRGPQIARAYEKYAAPFGPQIALIPIYEKEFQEAVLDPPAPLPRDRRSPANVPALLSRFFVYGALRQAFAELASGWLSLDWASRRGEPRGQPRRTLRALQVLEEFARARSREQVTLVLTILPELDGDSEAQRQRFALELRRWAAGRPGVVVLDCASPLAGALGSGDRVYFGDKHPGARVHELYAAAIYDGIAPLLAARAGPGRPSSGVGAGLEHAPLPVRAAPSYTPAAPEPRGAQESRPMSDVEQTLFEIIRKLQPHGAPLRRGSRLQEDLRLSSLDFAEIVFALEDRLRIRIDFNANVATSFRTLDDVLRAVEELVAGKRAT